MSKSVPRTAYAPLLVSNCAAYISVIVKTCVCSVSTSAFQTRVVHVLLRLQELRRLRSLERAYGNLAPLFQTAAFQESAEPFPAETI
jgi:hypothetical protein